MVKHIIKEHFTKFYPQRLVFYDCLDPTKMSNGFVMKIRLSEAALKPGRNVILDIPGTLTISAGILSRQRDFENMSAYEKSECYFVYSDKEGNSPFLSASIWLESKEGLESGEMTLGIPLRLYPAWDKDVFLLYNGLYFCWIIDDEIVNIDYPFGEILYNGSNIVKDEKAFQTIKISYDISELEMSVECEEKEGSIAFYSPRGYNAWAGDVANFYYDDVYHLLFFVDRHHHRNRFSTGAHSVMHLTTKDFITWENHDIIYPINEQWQTFGTGSMFYHDGKYYYSFGYHSSRVLPEKLLVSSILEEQYKSTGRVTAITYDEIAEKDLYPSGANYLVSEDGIHFENARKVFHWSENPSIYAEGDTLKLYAGYGGEGIWKASKIDGPWEPADAEEDSVVFNCQSIMRNSSECPSKFAWNGYKYLIMGFTGFWQTQQHQNEFIDMAACGLDIYDGLCVPMVTNSNGRYILAGWLHGYGWAYIMQHRELIQKDNGRLGLRWLPELTPCPHALKKVSDIENITDIGEIKFTCRKSYYFECMVKPADNGKVGIGFSGEGTGCVLQFDSSKGKVQIKETQDTSMFTEELQTLYEAAPEFSDACNSYQQIPGNDWHFKGCDFAIGQVEEIREKYMLKLILHYEAKSDSLVIDAEIGGGRTMISNRRYFNANTMTVICKDAVVSDVHLFEM